MDALTGTLVPGLVSGWNSRRGVRRGLASVQAWEHG